MKEIRVNGRLSMFVSDDLFEHYGSDDLICVSQYENFVAAIDVEKSEYIDVYLGKTKKTAVLFAHGNMVKGQWAYFDNDISKTVQSWIDSKEKEFQTLVLMCCNVASVTPTNKKSLLVLPDRTFSFMLLGMGEVTISLIHPKLGELDHILAYELRMLKAKSKQLVRHLARH